MEHGTDGYVLLGILTLLTLTYLQDKNSALVQLSTAIAKGQPTNSAILFSKLFTILYGLMFQYSLIILTLIIIVKFFLFLNEIIITKFLC